MAKEDCPGEQPKALVASQNGFIEGGQDGIGAGRRCALGVYVEDQLEKCLLARAVMGFPVIISELMDLVGKYIADNAIISPFMTASQEMIGIIQS